MGGWHHRRNGHEFEQDLGVGDGQGSLVCCSPCSHKESDMTEQLNYFVFFCSNHCFFFSSINFGFILFLFFRYKVRLFAEVFLFPEVGLYCYKPVSQNCFFCVSQILDCVFIFISLQVLFISSLILQWLIGCLVAYCLASMYVWGFLSVFFPYN